MRALRIFKKATLKLIEDDGLFLARGLAFGLLVYCIPLGLLTVSGLSYTVLSSTRALDWVYGLAQALMPGFQRQFRDYLGDIIDNRGVLGAVGFLTFLFVSSTTFGSLRLVLNRVFRAAEPRGLIHGKLMEVAMTIATSAMLFVVIAFVYVLAVTESFLRSLPFLRRAMSRVMVEFPHLADQLRPGALAIISVVSIAATVCLFWFLYRFSPARAPSRRALLVGAVTATVLFEFSKWAFSWYVRYAQEAAALYGTLSGLVFFFLWLYYACVVFLFGAEVSWAFDHTD